MSSAPEPAKIEFKWFIADACNYRCPYCSVSGAMRPPTPPRANRFSAEQWTEAWRRVHEAYGSCFIHVTGGEPTLFPGYFPLLERVSQWHWIGFDTNLSWTWEQLERFCAQVPASRTAVDISFHPHTASVDDVARKAEYLRDRGYTNIVRLIAFPPLLPELAEYRDRFQSRGLRFVVNPFQGTHRGLEYPASYTPEERAAIQGISDPLKRGSAKDDQVHAFYVQHILKMHEESPLGKLCRSGQVYSRVTEDGTVYRCQPYESRGWEPLGNLLDSRFALRPGPTPCRADRCEYEYKFLVEYETLEWGLK